MIPYDDLVAALSQWRARQGLPVSTLGGGSAATPQPGSGPIPTPGSGPHGGSGPYSTKPGSGPNHGGPRGKTPSMPPPMPIETMEDSLDVDSALLEEQYEADGEYAEAYGQSDGEQTSIGGAPERPTEADMTADRDREDW